MEKLKKIEKVELKYMINDYDKFAKERQEQLKKGLIVL